MNLWRARLTPRERETLDLLTLGYSNREIAGRMGTSQQTAKNHVRDVFRALGVHDRTQAAVMALKFEIVDPAAVYAALDRRQMMIRNGGFTEGWHDIGMEEQQPATTPGPDWQALQRQAAALRAHLQQAQAMAERLAQGLDFEE